MKKVCMCQCVEVKCHYAFRLDNACVDYCQMNSACSTYQIAILKACETKITEPWPPSQFHHTSHTNLGILYSNSHFRDNLWHESELHKKVDIKHPTRDKAVKMDHVCNQSSLRSDLWFVFQQKMLTVRNHVMLYTLYGTDTRNWAC